MKGMATDDGITEPEAICPPDKLSDDGDIRVVIVDHLQTFIRRFRFSDDGDIINV
jgi:hypothetical protein